MNRRVREYGTLEDQEAAVEHLKHTKPTKYKNYKNRASFKLAAQGHHR